MTISAIVTPVAKVPQCYPSATIESALDVILAHPDKGAVVVLQEEGDKKDTPVGIVTKTDLLHAYKKNLDLNDTVECIMGRNIEKVLDTVGKDKAAEHFEKTKHYNAFVFNKEDKWVGLLTVLEVAMEGARDGRAWPWNRSEGVMEYFTKHAHSGSKRSVVKEPEQHPVEEAAQRTSFLKIAGANE